MNPAKAAFHFYNIAKFMELNYATVDFKDNRVDVDKVVDVLKTAMDDMAMV